MGSDWLPNPSLSLCYAGSTFGAIYSQKNKNELEHKGSHCANNTGRDIFPGCCTKGMVERWKNKPPADGGDKEGEEGE